MSRIFIRRRVRTIDGGWRWESAEEGRRRFELRQAQVNEIRRHADLAERRGDLKRARELRDRAARQQAMINDVYPPRDTKDGDGR